MLGDGRRTARLIRAFAYYGDAVVTQAALDNGTPDEAGRGFAQLDDLNGGDLGRLGVTGKADVDLAVVDAR